MAKLVFNKKTLSVVKITNSLRELNLATDELVIEISNDRYVEIFNTGAMVRIIKNPLEEKYACVINNEYPQWFNEITSYCEISESSIQLPQNANLRDIIITPAENELIVFDRIKIDELTLENNYGTEKLRIFSSNGEYD
jgi:hypothetical protein